MLRSLKSIGIIHLGNLQLWISLLLKLTVDVHLVFQTGTGLNADSRMTQAVRLLQKVDQHP